MTSDKKTVTQLHNNKLNEIIAVKARLPLLKAELECLEKQIRRDISIIERKTSKLRIHKIKRK